MTQVRVNIKTAVNASKIRRERRNGRDVIVVPSATLPDNVVMNGIRYPADEIEKAYHTLERTPAPLGHPSLNGAFVSAKDPEGLVRGFIGAWNENVRRENGRVFIDKVIDVDYANATAGGKAVLAAIEKAEPIHTSTGLYGIRTALQNDDEAKWVMTDMVFDHDAILIGEDGAATPEQGVGMLVNAKDQEGHDVEVVNSALDSAHQSLDWAGQDLIRAVEQLQRASKWETIKHQLLKIFGIEPATNQGDEGAMDKAQYDELSGKLDKLGDSIAEKLGETIGNALTKAMEPMTTAVNQMTAAAEAEAKTKKEGLVNQVVRANLVSEDTAKALPVNVLEEMVANAKPAKPGGAIAPGAQPQRNNGDQQVYQLPKAGK